MPPVGLLALTQQRCRCTLVNFSLVVAARFSVVPPDRRRPFPERESCPSFAPAPPPGTPRCHQEQVKELIGIKESDTGLSQPSQWDLVSDKQMMQEEQPLQVRPSPSPPPPPPPSQLPVLVET